MPRRDGTGPVSQGMMTGRKLGNCITQTNTSNEPSYLGNGCRKGRRGINRNFNNGISKQMLQDQISDLQAQINALK